MDYKWRNFAQRRIYIKALVYLVYTLCFTIFAVLFADDDPSVSHRGFPHTWLTRTSNCRVLTYTHLDTRNSYCRDPYRCTLHGY